MNKVEVTTTSKKKPMNMIGGKQYPNGTTEIEEYYNPVNDSTRQYYWLYFWNDKLVKYDTPEWRNRGRFNPWQDEMDKTYYSLNLDKK